MKLSVGKKVGFLREKGTAIILEIKGSKIRIEDSDGFEREILASEVIELHSVENAKPTELASCEESNLKIKGVLQTRLEKKANVSKQHQVQTEWEIDLHIEELVDSIAGMSNTEIVLKQLTYFKSKFSAAKTQRINRLVVIHGVGEGVLRSEIHAFLLKESSIEFMDADFRKYGKGATLVIFHPNW